MEEITALLEHPESDTTLSIISVIPFTLWVYWCIGLPAAAGMAMKPSAFPGVMRYVSYLDFGYWGFLTNNGNTGSRLLGGRKYGYDGPRGERNRTHLRRESEWAM